jgi:hypothetical protein
VGAGCLVQDRKDERSGGYTYATRPYQGGRQAVHSQGFIVREGGVEQGKSLVQPGGEQFDSRPGTWHPLGCSSSLGCDAESAQSSDGHRAETGPMSIGTKFLNVSPLCPNIRDDRRVVGEQGNILPRSVDWKACTPRMTAFISKILMERQTPPLPTCPSRTDPLGHMGAPPNRGRRP